MLCGAPGAVFAVVIAACRLPVPDVFVLVTVYTVAFAVSAKTHRKMIENVFIVFHFIPGPEPGSHKITSKLTI